MIHDINLGSLSESRIYKIKHKFESKQYNFDIHSPEDTTRLEVCSGFHTFVSSYSRNILLPTLRRLIYQ